MPAATVITFSLNILSAIVALLTSYYAYKSNRLVGSTVLSSISIGFMLLGWGNCDAPGPALGQGNMLDEVPVARRPPRHAACS